MSAPGGDQAGGGDALDVGRLAQIVVDMIQRHGISFVRGEPRDYFTRLSRVNAGLTLPVVAPADLPEVVLLKNLYVLWNFIMDDEMDREGTRTNLDASIGFLLGDASAERAESDAVKVLTSIFSRLPNRRPDDEAALRFDLWEVVHGLNYEYYINRSARLANSLEYGKYSTMTASVKVLLDVDCMACPRPIGHEPYSKLRLAYEHLTLAIKYSSDVGTLRRELTEEKNLNAVRIRAAEEHLLDLAYSVSSPEEYESVLGRVRPVMDEVRNIAKRHFDAALRLLSSVPSVDSTLVLQTVASLIQPYNAGEDPFFDAGSSR
jgi:hypothetical protein